MESVLYLDKVETTSDEYYDPFEDSLNQQQVCPSSHGSLKIVRNDDDEFTLKCSCCEFSV